MGFGIGLSAGVGTIIYAHAHPSWSEVKAENAAREQPVPIPPAMQESVLKGSKEAGLGHPSEALKFLGRPALDGDADAQFEIGKMYATGSGIPADQSEAVKWWTLAAAQGQPLAQISLAGSLVSGEGISIDLAAARAWLLRAAASNNALAARYAAVMLLGGQGGPVDSANGLRLFKQAAANGDEIAQSQLPYVGYRITLDELLSFALTKNPSGISFNQLAMLSNISANVNGIQGGRVQGTEIPEFKNTWRSNLNTFSVAPPSIEVQDQSSQPRPIENTLDTNALVARSQFDGQNHPYSPGTLGKIANGRPGNIGAIDPATGEYYSPAGTGYVSSRNGTYYAPAGPNGVIDTRTGQFIPRN